MIPIYRYMIQILHYKIGIIPIYRYQYAQNPPYRTDTDIPNIPHTEPIPILIPTDFFSYRYQYQVSVPGIVTWYRYHTGYRSNSTGNSIISSAWPNQTYSPILSYWLIVCRYKMSANRRAVSLSAPASFQFTTTIHYTNDGALSKRCIKKIL